ncbi:hypothetical protein FRX31_016358 [Thalictrum thalictroides]|uniref:Dnase i-like superfamily protein n=1 Tax=Thalictrum thalictroides TaxID=46969 RepID=A0A7J6WAR1_THATH|nr:hypothetical protein FRX31_016358 [Thalictrum thalictroides]
MGVVETRVKEKNKVSVFRNIGLNWPMLENYEDHYNGRIWLLWNPTLFHVVRLCSTSQLLHVQVKVLQSNFCFYATVIYASNDGSCRQLLWDKITSLATTIDCPWIVFGDFNNVLVAEEKEGGELIHPREIMGFQECLHNAGLVDMAHTGCQFTWSNKSEGDHRIATKIDRSLVNEAWLDKCGQSISLFLTPVLSDHSPCVVVWPDRVSRREVPFKFFNA